MEQSFSETALLDALRDIRLPETAAGGLLGEILVCIGFAALSAGLLTALIQLVFRRRPVKPAPSLAAQIQALRDLPEDRRRVALLHLLRQKAPERYAAMSSTFYKPAGLEMEMLEAEVQRLV